MPYPGLKPNCSYATMLFSSDYFNNLLVITDVKVFITDVKATDKGTSFIIICIVGITVF